MNTFYRRRPLGQRLADTAAAVILFPLLYVLAWILDRQDRKTGGTR